ncbi:MAG: hypothetical protein AD742_17320 [Methylibium sp. NZG]|nr:MAG: hypothetical protein AD742_17320 [Methylibium sp. NZG]
MNLRQPTARWAAWAFAVLLLLKAAVPLLASASAQLQGKTLVEVCTVYGVTTVALEGADSSPQTEHGGAAHGGEHCALTALMMLPAPALQALAMPAVPQRADAVAASCPPPRAPDACATWVARLKHGPPAHA